MKNHLCVFRFPKELHKVRMSPVISKILSTFFSSRITYKCIAWKEKGISAILHHFDKSSFDRMFFLFLSFRTFSPVRWAPRSEEKQDEEAEPSTRSTTVMKVDGDAFVTACSSTSYDVEEV